jgi:hypothetical protein
MFLTRVLSHKGNQLISRELSNLIFIVGLVDIRFSLTSPYTYTSSPASFVSLRLETG